MKVPGCWLAYSLLLAACAFLLRQDTDFYYFTGAIIFSTTVIALIGIPQYFGMDLFRSDFGLWLILPAKFITANLGFTFGPGTIYSTFYNTNYGGSIAGIALPLAVCLCLFVPSFKKGGLLLLGYTLLIFVLATGSRSQAGTIGLFVAFTFLIIYLARHYRSNFKQLVLIFAIFASIYLGVDIYVDGPVSGKFTDIFWGDKLAVEPSVADALIEQQKHVTPMQAKIKVFFDKKIIEYGLLGSGRGYIYLRALEQRLTIHSMLGTGPDTFAIFFPQDDVLRSHYGFPMTQLIDKMHSMFLQIWFNTGFISFAAFMVMLLLHFVNSVQIFWNVRTQTTIEVLGLGFFLGWAGFLGTSLFNDSAISVSPYFWAVFGASIAANHVIISPKPLFAGGSAPVTKSPR
jgi:O-antigen ligase